ncbi:unnamed protein product [Diamesa serratosioi]
MTGGLNKNVLVIGSGGREHAICWKLQLSDKVNTIYAFPGSAGISQLLKVKIVTELSLKDFKGIAVWCKSNKIDLVAVGPEDPLADGIADVLSAEGVLCFGPSKKGAQIEANKDWSKAFMLRNNIPTAKYASFKDSTIAKEFIRSASYDALVVKASGLAAGKGVIVAENIEQACDAVDEILGDRKFGSAGDVVVIEEKLSGEEVSVLAFVDNESVRVLLPAQDHKRLKDNDEGLNTGGMGAYCPCPLISKEDMELVKSEVLQRAVDGLRSEGIKYNGILYAGMMLTPDGPKTLEFNCRFGDPETQVILPLLETDLYDLMVATSSNELKQFEELTFKKNLSAVGVIMASRGYPETSTKGCVIKGMDVVADKPQHLVFHSGVAKSDAGEYTTNGGRVLINVALSDDLKKAAALATSACKDVIFDGAQYRNDIAKKAFKSTIKSITYKDSVSYKDSGVDITAGDALVQQIKPHAKSTNREGVIGGLGGFGGLFRLNALKKTYKDPVLVLGTDGVGTKLKIAQQLKKHGSVGIDLVAMCANDILCNGAEPLTFLDYFACGKLDVKVAADVISGIAEGCRQSGSVLLGGETAEMPTMYAPGVYDLAGFSLGIVEYQKILPMRHDINVGDIIIGLPSNGVHSNGFSLVHKLMELSNYKLEDVAPFSANGKTFGEELLEPTKIYVQQVLPALETGCVKAIAHVTGGGLWDNIPRVLPPHLTAELQGKQFIMQPIFGWISSTGVAKLEMMKTFNCGLGMILIASPANEVTIMKTLYGTGASVLGKVIPTKPGGHQCIIRYFAHCIERVERLLSVPKKRVGVLISGSGSNLQALIDATKKTSMGMCCEIVHVISNKSDVYGLERAAKAGVSSVVISNKDYPSREDFDAALNTELERNNIDIVCLAGFMRILTSSFVQKWKGRLLNIHPSLLPKYKGTKAQEEALEAGDSESGCTVHFVDENVDTGATIIQEIVPILKGDTVETLSERILVAEHISFPRALRLVTSGYVKLNAKGQTEWV